MLCASGQGWAAEEDVPPSEPRVLGGRGRWVIDLVGGQVGGASGVGALGGLGGWVGPLSIRVQKGLSGPAGFDATTTFIALTPSLDAFVTDRLTLGGRLAAGVFHSTAAQGGDVTGYGFGAVPRVGYVFPISSSMAFWPRLGAGYELARDVSEPRTRFVHTLQIESMLGVGLRLARHALLDLGPSLSFRHIDRDTTSGVAVDAGFRATLRVDF